MLRESSHEVLALGRLRDELIGWRVLLAIYGLGLCLATVFGESKDGGGPAERVALFVLGLAFLVFAHALGRAKEWTRHAIAGSSAAMLVAYIVWACTGLTWSELDAFGVILLLIGFVACALPLRMWSESTALQFRRARAAIARSEQAR